MSALHHLDFLWFPDHSQTPHRCHRDRLYQLETTFELRTPACALSKSSWPHPKSLYCAQPLSFCDALLLVAPAHTSPYAPGSNASSFAAVALSALPASLMLVVPLARLVQCPQVTAPLVHMCQYLRVRLPVLGHFSKPGVPKVFKEDRCVIGSDCTSTCPGLLHMHWVAWTVAQTRHPLYTERCHLTPQHPQERHQC